MKLATFEQPEGRERWGLVLGHPATGEEWVFDPAETVKQLGRYFSNGTSGFQVYRPSFAADAWPLALKDFLDLAGLESLDNRNPQPWIRGGDPFFRFTGCVCWFARV